MTNINCFDQRGHFILDTLVTQEAEIRLLSDDHRQRLVTLAKAAMADKAGQERIRAARIAVHEKEVAHANALEADQKSNPPITAHQAQRAAIDANAGRPVAQPKVNKKTRAALEAADVALADAHIEMQHAQTAARDAERAYGAACDQWRRCCHTPSDEEVRRQYIASGNAARIALKAETGSADKVEPVPAGQWALQKAMKARGRQENRFQSAPTKAH
jgi:hypothetical protein